MELIINVEEVIKELHLHDVVEISRKKWKDAVANAQINLLAGYYGDYVLATQALSEYLVSSTKEMGEYDGND